MGDDKNQGRDLIYVDMKESFHTVVCERIVYEVSKYITNSDFFS